MTQFEIEVTERLNQLFKDVHEIGKEISSRLERIEDRLSSVEEKLDVFIKDVVNLRKQVREMEGRMQRN